jgi:hypothetical protein
MIMMILWRVDLLRRVKQFMWVHSCDLTLILQKFKDVLSLPSHLRSLLLYGGMLFALLLLKVIGLLNARLFFSFVL